MENEFNYRIAEVTSLAKITLRWKRHLLLAITEDVRENIEGIEHTHVAEDQNQNHTVWFEFDDGTKVYAEHGGFAERFDTCIGLSKKEKGDYDTSWGRFRYDIEDDWQEVARKFTNYLREQRNKLS